MNLIKSTLDGISRVFTSLTAPPAPSPLAEGLERNYDVKPQKNYAPGFDLGEVFKLDLDHEGLSLDIRILKPSSPSDNPNMGAQNFEVHVALARNGVVEARKIPIEIAGYESARWHDEAAMKEEIAAALEENRDGINSLCAFALRPTDAKTETSPKIRKNPGL